MTEISFTVPLVPPSVNHYKMRTRKGVTFVSKEARAFKAAVAICAKGICLRAETYEVTVVIFLGHNKRGDIDNFLKCALDGMVSAGVIHSDAAITRLIAEKSRDIKNPRTEYTVRAL